MQLFGMCCSSCKYCKVVMKPFPVGNKTVAWCKKHRENFELHSLCESYECKESEAENETDN